MNKLHYCPSCLNKLSEIANNHVCEKCQLKVKNFPRLWLSQKPVFPKGFDKASTIRLANLIKLNHFWIRERRNLVQKLLNRLERLSNRKFKSALELGCGAGQMLDILESSALQVTAVDGYDSLLELAYQNSSSTVLIQDDVTKTNIASDRFDLIVAFDVIEHVHPDNFLKEAYRLASNGAILLISAPAFPSLWSELDIKSGHRCRYRWHQLDLELKKNGWKPIGHTHFQFLLFPLVFLLRRFGVGDINKLQQSPSSWIDDLLGFVNKIEVKYLNKVTLPFGSSVFVWARVEK